MDAIILAFAHSKESPLPALEQECKVISSLLVQEQRKSYTIWPIEYANKGNIVDGLKDLRTDVSVFMYSGHADSEALLLDDAEASADGLKELLAQCPKLRLVILNGCNTEDQVDALLRLGDFAVVATNDRIGDDNAKRFSIELFRSLVAGNTLQKAFDEAKAAAWNDKYELHRGYRPGWEKSEKDPESKWGLFTTSEDSSILNWKLIAAELRPDFKVNSHLISALFGVLVEHSEAARKIKQNEDMGIETDSSVKIRAIIESLPILLRKQIGRLLVPPEQDEYGDFFNKAGLARLKELVSTYMVATELLVAAFLSQLWTLCDSRDVTFNEDELAELRYYLLKEGDLKKTFNSALFIRSLRKVLSRYDVEYFIEELQDLDAYEIEAPLKDSIDFFEDLKVRIESTTSNEAMAMCEEAEIHLAKLLTRVGFLMKYTLLSVRDIDVFKYRHIAKPLYTYSGLDNDPKTYVMDRRSVLMIHDEAEGKFVNLTPFLIDINSFPTSRQRTVTDLNKPKRFASFSHYDRSGDKFVFRDIGRNVTGLEAEKDLHQILRLQLEAFSKMIFKKPIAEI